MNPDETQLQAHLAQLKLAYVQEHYQSLAEEAAQKQWTAVEYLRRLIEGEALRHLDRTVQHRIAAARFPVLKTLDQFNWNWPKKINRPQVQNLFRLAFLEQHTNVVLLGGCGLGKTHLAVALGYAACQQRHKVLFVTAVEVINTLLAAQATHTLPEALKRYLRPHLLILDELGYLPIDKAGADLLFQVFSGRYERGSTLITTNQAYKNWLRIFNNDSTLTSAVLDRVLHHAETVPIEGKSYRMKEVIEEA
jgi:DNA replication protein DnaC